MSEVIDNLALLLRRTSRKLHPTDPLRTQCVVYLKSIGQAGQPLRPWRVIPNAGADEAERDLEVASSDLLDWLRGKLAEAEKTLKTREDMASLMRTGTNAEWKAAADMHPSTSGQTATKTERLKEAEAHDRIAIRLRHDLDMFRAALMALDHPHPR